MAFTFIKIKLTVKAPDGLPHEIIEYRHYRHVRPSPSLDKKTEPQFSNCPHPPSSLKTTKERRFQATVDDSSIILGPATGD